MKFFKSCIVEIKPFFKGFTLPEMMIAITIAVILASFVGVSFRKFVETKRREVEIITFWKELSGLRAKAMKYDYRYIVTFNTGANTYQIYKDLNDGNDVSDDEKVTSVFSPKIVFCTSPWPGSGPAGTIAPGAAIDGSWAAAGIKIQRDNLGTVNDGRIFLKVPNISNVWYCIMIPVKNQVFKLYKWTGAKWIEM